MLALNVAAGRLAAAVVIALVPACKPKASPSQCDALIARYAQLVVTEEFPDASADQVRLEQERERSEARGDDVFKNCSSEVSQTEFGCAMGAATPDAFEKCLE
ncbi:MAG TPA: hypothetical protein VKU41_32095 [Polyangiaceae bacterium]|nr:hypothetical protein [Polyangiaceae bacterium]